MSQMTEEQVYEKLLNIVATQLNKESDEIKKESTFIQDYSPVAKLYYIIDWRSNTNFVESDLRIIITMVIGQGSFITCNRHFMFATGLWAHPGGPG